MFDQELLEKYAELAVKKGVNIYKGQPVMIECNVEALEMARIVCKKAYEAGAGVVKVKFNDDIMNKYSYQFLSDEELKEVPDYTIDEKKYWINRNYCRIVILSDDPLAMNGINPEKIQLSRKAYYEKAGEEILNYSGSNKGQWTIIGYPSVKWAKTVFPECSDEEAMNKLMNAILSTSRVYKDTNPLDEWDKHNKFLKEHAEKMNNYNFVKLHYSNSLGTDLDIYLPEGHIWEGGCEVTNNDKKIIFNPNIPSEEIFTTPHRNKIDGIVYSSKPLIHNGNKIDNFWIKFKDGRIVDYDAKVGKECLKSIIDTDEGSHYLGEVALVPYHSPISESNILFYETLYDENASCHLAIGDAYPTTVKGAEPKSKEERIEMGVNNSFEHVDFMVGTKDLSIVGTTKDGKEIEVFKNGDFVF